MSYTELFWTFSHRYSVGLSIISMFFFFFGSVLFNNANICASIFHKNEDVSYPPGLLANTSVF